MNEPTWSWQGCWPTTLKKDSVPRGSLVYQIRLDKGTVERIGINSGLSFHRTTKAKKAERTYRAESKGCLPLKSRFETSVCWAHIPVQGHRSPGREP